MKISPVAQGAAPSANLNEGMSASPDRLARAKAVFSGQDPATAQADPQVERAQSSLKRIKMRTQVSPDRHMLSETTQSQDVSQEQEKSDISTQSDTSAPIEQAQAANEESKPLSPQFAALAKQKRMLQLKEQELLAKEKSFETQSSDTKSLEEYRANIKANALKVLIEEEGYTFDQLIEQVSAYNQGNADLSGVKSEIKAIKDALDNQNKSLSERDAQAEKQVRASILKDANQLIAQGDDYEMIREAGYAPKVEELIYRTFKESGELMDVTEAANLIENELLEESLKFARLKKVQSRVNPAPTQQTQAVQQDRPGTKIMRTLTNRDGASSASMSKRERAIAAMEGRLK